MEATAANPGLANAVGRWFRPKNGGDRVTQPAARSRASKKIGSPAVGARAGASAQAATESTAALALRILVSRAQQGEEDAQRDLIIAYQHRVAGFVYAITGRGDYVDHLTQQVFIKMIRALDQLRAPGQFESWFFRLARNLCIDHLRRQKLRQIFLPLDCQHEDVAEPAGGIDTEELDALRYALAQLRPEDRALLALVQEGRSQAEIAEIHSTTVAAVKARLHRTRARLCEHYQPRGGN